MKNLLKKEIKLASSPLTYFFLAFPAMTMLPGYPILLGAFFVCLGIFYSFQNGRETNDILYTVLLPVRKSDAVKAKYLFACFFQIIAFLAAALFTAIRMTVLKDAPVYRSNALMNANLTFLAFVLLMFAAFNVIFLGGFFRTAYGIGKPLLFFIIAAMVLIGAAETLHHLPGLSFLNDSEGAPVKTQCAVLLAAGLLYGLSTYASGVRAERRFERIDL